MGRLQRSVDAVDNGDAVTVANVSRQFTVPAGFHIGDLVVFQQVAVQTVIQSAVCFRLFLCNIQFCIRCHLGLFCFRIGRDQVSVRRGLCFDTALVGVRLGLFLLLLGLDRSMLYCASTSRSFVSIWEATASRLEIRLLAS